MAPKTRAAIERFHGLTELRDDGCLVWIGSIASNGYARHWVDGRNVSAHRWSYEYHVGPIGEGLHIDHLCRNRACVNPAHLEPVTPAENTRRGMLVATTRARWANTTHCRQGHPYDEENTHMTPKGRSCRTCKRASSQRHYQAHRQQYADKTRAWQLANPERTREIGRETARRIRAKKKAN